MVEENRCQSRGDLLDDIKRGSKLLEQQLLQFIDWIDDRKIVSFVEMQQTKKLQKVREIKNIYPAASSPNCYASCWFSPPLYYSSQSRPQTIPPRKYMQGQDWGIGGQRALLELNMSVWDGIWLPEMPATAAMALQDTCSGIANTR